ncbi:MAG TPA: hypothetical protein VGG64_29955 [Pirellulales bacterium]
MLRWTAAGTGSAIGRKRVDGIIALVLFVSSFSLALGHLEKVGWGSFYQQTFAPALAWACTGKFESLALDKPAVRDFLSGTTPSFNCSDLPAPPADRVPLYSLQYQTLYLIAAAAGIWAVAGVKWTALFIIGALLAAAMNALIYGICRLFVGIPWAAAATILATLSPLNAAMLPELRDYSKAPFVLGVILLCGWLLKAIDGPRRFIGTAAVAGIVAGVGFGVRADLSIAVPFFIIVLVLVLMITRFRLYREVLIAAVLFGVTIVATAAPILAAYRGGGIIGHVALLGLTTPFNKPLGLAAAPYDIGHLYMDESMYQFTQEFALGHQGQAGAPQEIHDTPTGLVYAAYALRAYLTYTAHFPADMLVRAYSAVSQVISLDLDDGRVPAFPEFLYRLRNALVWHGAALIFFASSRLL